MIFLDKNEATAFLKGEQCEYSQVKILIEGDIIGAHLFENEEYFVSKY